MVHLTKGFHVCPVVDDDFCHNITKVAVDLQGKSQVESADCFDNVMTKFIASNRTDA